MTSQQNILDYVKDQMQQGKMTAAEANVQTVLMQGVRLIQGKVIAEVRKALNEAVKAGTLGHLKRDGLKPEAYFHPNSIYRAKEERNREEFKCKSALKGVTGY